MVPELFHGINKSPYFFDVLYQKNMGIRVIIVTSIVLTGFASRSIFEE